MSPRILWSLFEPLHAVTYFAPEARAAFEDAGLRGFWRGYFAGRSAPLGPTGPAPVTALFAGFAPGMVERALPGVWDLVTPARALAARSTGAVAALGVVLAGHEDAVREASVLLRAVAEGADHGGRALGAANAGLAWPEEPLAVLWHAATVLREVRGDGHVAAQVTEGLSGLDTMVLRSGHDQDRAVLQPARGWSDDEWTASADSLVERGLLGDDRRTTDAGGDLLAHLEVVTDRLAAQPWRAVGAAATERSAAVLSPLAARATTVLPAATPIGLPPT